MIGIALSGGGTRAIAFHAGVLRRLATGGLLERIVRVSTVSGGSIAVAALLGRGKHTWPTSSEYLTRSYVDLRELATTTPIVSASVLARMPGQWGNLIADRARVLAHCLQVKWGVVGRLSNLPANPDWIVNATCYETGKNWRFSRKEMGDWMFGRHFSPDYSIAEVAAASAAVPYAIGALKFKLPSEGWYQIVGRAETLGGRKTPPSESVHLWDGGAYENLGLEPLYKVETGPNGCDKVIVSDASGPVAQGRQSLLRTALSGNLPSPKLFDIASDQIRSLRSRIIVDAFQRGAVQGAVFRMGNSVRDIDLKSGFAREEHDYSKYLPDAAATEALQYPTNLSALNQRDFDLLARHGFELADATLTAYCRALAPERMYWP